MIARKSDDGVSRMPLLFTTVGVLIAASVVSLVLVSTQDDSSGSRAAAAGPPSVSATVSAGPTTTTPSAAATSATPMPTSSPSTSPVARNSSVAAQPASETPATRKAITYTVKTGDNLTVIAAWFKLHGYGDLYQANKKVIGADPDLIRPGQRITVSSDGMTLSRK